MFGAVYRTISTHILRKARLRTACWRRSFVSLTRKLREQPAGVIDDMLAAVGVVAVGDIPFDHADRAQVQRFGKDCLRAREAVMQLDHLHVVRARAMVRSINEIGHLTRKQSIAEGEEDAELI